ncbi:MAG: amino acid kinase [Gammaproteobacteria bacterium]|nr:amino acid kinase [Gammaproteobacteria bacterium]
MWVVKLGGSLFSADCLRDWVDRLAASERPLVVVPGGGPFADQVRDAQQRWQIDDAHAHAMALLAMEQMGLMLCALNSGLVPCSNSMAIRSALADGHVAVWMPSRHVLAQNRIQGDWSVTSDSLSLWLAGELGAQGVLVVKSAPLRAAAASAAALQSEGIVDGAFDRFARALVCPVWLVHRQEHAALEALLSEQCPAAVRVVSTTALQADAQDGVAVSVSRT